MIFSIYLDGELINHPFDENQIILQPRLTLEMGKAGSLEFGLPPIHPVYHDIKRLKTTVSVEMCGIEIFRGRVLSAERNFYNVRKVYCEGNLSYLMDSEQKPRKFDGWTHDLFREVVAEHNQRVDAEKQFSVGNITIDNMEIHLTGPSDEIENDEVYDYDQIAVNSVSTEWKKTFNYIETCLIEHCGGYLRTRKVGNVVYLDLLKDYGHAATQEIEFGVNLLDLTEESESEDIFTVLIPIGDDNLTIESVNNGSDELIDEDGVAEYGRIVKSHVFESVNEAETLLENGQRYMANHENYPSTIVATALDLHLTNSDVQAIFIGDAVPVRSAPHWLQDTLTCTKIIYDLEDISQTEFTFGTPRQTLTDRYRRNKAKQQSDLASASTKGAGGAGSAANKKAEETAQKELTKFYDAWINITPEMGKVDLGAVYQELVNTNKVLEQQVGIDLDAPAGNVNIHSLRQEFDESERLTSSQLAEIDLLVNDNKSQIEATVMYVDDVKDTEAAHYASLSLLADEQGSAIALKADKVYVDAEITTVKKLVASEIEAEIGNIETSIAESIITGSITATSGVIGALTLGGDNVTKKKVPVVTSFSQASGEQASTIDITFLVTAASAEATHNVALGETKSFAA